jgi:hypothetical protein
MLFVLVLVPVVLPLVIVPNVLVSTIPMKDFAISGRVVTNTTLVPKSREEARNRKMK